MHTNEKKEFKLIALDMDGTLLNNQQEISKENREAIA
ncbi:HAD hydrolase family protein, partial [Priestia megaterium]